MELVMSKEEFLGLLKTSIVNITFTKQNGEERILNGTLLTEYLPDRPNNSSKQLLTESQDSNNVRVYDVDLQGWRTIKMDRIKSINMEGK